MPYSLRAVNITFTYTSHQKCWLCRTLELEAVFLRPGILLTTYGMVQHNTELFCTAPLESMQQGQGIGVQNASLWDFMILDEVNYTAH